MAGTPLHARLERPFRRLRSWFLALAWFDWVLVGTLLVVGVLRFQILKSGGAPPTIDSGNWLAFGDRWLGNSSRSTSIVYPPLVPLLTRGLVGLFGTTVGVSLMAAFSSLAPAMGAYVGLRYLGLQVGALVPALLLVGPGAIGEATAWGGFPQLIGFGLVPVVLIAVDKWLRNWSVRDALTAGAAMMLLLATSHFIGATVAIAVAVMAMLGLVWPVGAGRTWRHELASIGLVLIPSIWLVPIYLTIGDAMGGASQEFQSFDGLTWSNLLDRIEFLYRDFPWLWRIILPVSIVTPFVLIRHHRTALWRVTVSLACAILAVTIITREARFLYFLTILGAFAVALWLDRILSGPELGRVRSEPTERGVRLVGVLSVAMLAIVGWQIGLGMTFFREQRNYYGILDSGLVAAIEYVDENLEPGGTIAVPSLRDAPLGWWVEAMTHDPVFYGSPLRWLVFDDEIERASFANTIFAPPFPTDEKLDLARSADVQYVIIPTRWWFYDSDAISQLEQRSPEVIVFKNESVIVLRL